MCSSAARHPSSYVSEHSSTSHLYSCDHNMNLLLTVIFYVIFIIIILPAPLHWSAGCCEAALSQTISRFGWTLSLEFSKEREDTGSAGGGVLISLGELVVQTNEAESLFMEFRIIFMIISTFSGCAAESCSAQA